MAADVNQSSRRRDFCVMHVINSAKGKLTSFTYTSWCKFVSFAAKWRKLECKEAEIAIEAAAKLGLRLKDFDVADVEFGETLSSSDGFLPIPAYCKFHRDCYNRFCNTLMVGKEEKRQNTRDKEAAKTGKHSEELLPPKNDSLRNHVLRANYQAAVWRRCFEQAQDLPGPVGNGWQLSDDGALEIQWCELPCAPESVLMTVQCSCKTGRRSGAVCGCIRDNLPCTTMRQCQGCTNNQEQELAGDEIEDSGSQEEDDEFE